MNPQQVRMRLEKEREELNKKYVGISVNEVRKLWSGEINVVENNGVAYAVTLDYKPSRLNLYIKNDLIYKVSIG
jgi:hypothetical protein